MCHCVVYFLKDFIVQVFMHIVVSHEVQLVSAVFCTFLQVLETKLHHQITVAFQTFVPNDPQVLLDWLPLRVLGVVFWLFRFRWNRRFSQFDDFSVGVVIFETFVLDWSEVPEVFVHFVFGPVPEEESVEEGVVHEKLRRSQFGRKVLREVSHDVVIKFMSKSELARKVSQVFKLYFWEKGIQRPSTTHIKSQLIRTNIVVDSNKSKVINCQLFEFLLSVFLIKRMLALLKDWMQS